MPSGKLQGVRVAILVGNGFEELELLDPKWTLDHEGAAMFIIAPTKNKVTGWNQGREEKQVPVDIALKSAKAEDFHALLLPGGRTSAAHLANNDKALEFVRNFMHAGKPVAAIGEGLRLLLQAGTLRGRKVTHGVLPEGDLQSAGASVSNENLVRDGNLITACRLDDVSAFVREMTRVLADLRQHSANMRKTA
jgi:protease I